MADNLADLKAKLRAREGKSGYEANVKEIKRVIEEAEANGYIYRLALNGKFVTQAYAEEYPETTYRQKVGG